MAAWLVFSASLICGYAAYSNVTPLEYFLDEETGGFISGGMFIAWAVIWYFIGSVSRRRYLKLKDAYMKAYPDVDRKELDRVFRAGYFAKSTRTLAVVFGTAVPLWLVIGFSTGITVKDYVVAAAFAVLAVTCLSFYREIKKKMA